MTAWPDDTALTPADLEAARHEGREDREVSDLLSAMLDEMENNGFEFHFADLPDGGCVSEMWRGGKKVAGGFGTPWSQRSLGDHLAEGARRPA